jgi:glucosamine-6-phosphate deaminase
MRVQVFDDAAGVAVAGADRIAEAVVAKPDLVLTLPTGRTPLAMYAEMAARGARGVLSLERATAFHMDELVLPYGDPRTFRAVLTEHVWSRLGPDEPRRLSLDTAVADLDAECRRYQAALERAGGLDLAVLGLGVDGHVAYNLPRPPSLSTHVLTLPDDVADENRVPREARPLRALTLGLVPLNHARRVVLVATGASKAEPIRRLACADGVYDPDWPCTFLSGHADLTLLLDRAAAAALPR